MVANVSTSVSGGVAAVGGVRHPPRHHSEPGEGAPPPAAPEEIQVDVKEEEKEESVGFLGAIGAVFSAVGEVFADQIETTSRSVAGGVSAVGGAQVPPSPSRPPANTTSSTEQAPAPDPESGVPR